MNARYTGSNLTGGDLIGAGLPSTSSANNVLGVTGAYIHDPGSGNTNYDSGIAGSHDINTNFFLVCNTWRKIPAKVVTELIFKFCMLVFCYKSNIGG